MRKVGLRGDAVFVDEAAESARSPWVAGDGGPARGLQPHEDGVPQRPKRFLCIVGGGAFSRGIRLTLDDGSVRLRASAQEIGSFAAMRAALCEG